MTRTERQQEAARKWIKNKGKGTIVAPTGAGKTRIAIITVKALLKKYPNIRVLIVVPTITLKNQWQQELDEWGLLFNAEVWVINSVIKHSFKCDCLILDETHRYSADTYSQVFGCINYKLIMGLTATFERLDGKEKITNKYCPIIDEITKAECLANGWISDYKEYQVLIDVDDIDVYKEYNKEWIEHFEFFRFDFKLAMSMVGSEGWRNVLAFRDELCPNGTDEERKNILQSIKYHSVRFMKTMQLRKSFINNHPKKIEIARKIMEARPNSKIITFSNNIKMAEALENNNYVYSGKTSKKKGRVMIEDFISGKIKHLHSIQRLNEGFNVPDISVGIILGTDSSEIKAVQKRGRIIRKDESKNAEIFYIIINNTIESKWYANSHKKDQDYITIDENGLDQVLKGEQPNLYKKKIQELKFRF